jgi:site-specific recombinase XerD
MDVNGDKVLLDAFAARLSRQGYAATSITKYRHGAADFLQWWQRDPAKARRVDIETYLDYVGASATPGTVRNRIAALKRLYDYIDSLGRMVDTNGNEIRSPLDRIEPPRLRTRIRMSARAS